MINMRHYHHYSRQWKPNRCKRSVVHVVYINHIFSFANTTFEVNQNWLNCREEYHSH